MYTHQAAGPISETFTSVRSVFISCPEKAAHFYFISNLIAKNTAFKKCSKAYGLPAEKQGIIKKERTLYLLYSNWVLFEAKGRTE